MNDGTTRRQFAISTIAAATVAAKGVSRAFPANERIPLAVIGCRNRGHQVAAHCLGSDCFDVVALCDCDTAMQNVAMSKLEKVLPRSPRLERDFRRALNDREVAAVIITTPDHWHALMAVTLTDDVQFSRLGFVGSIPRVRDSSNPCAFRCRMVTRRRTGGAQPMLLEVGAP